MVIYNTKEEAKAVLRNKELPFGASIILNTKDGDLLGVQGKFKIKFLDMNTLPPTDGKSNQVLKLDENGNMVWADDEVRTIVDNLDSTSTDAALSANMGRELNSIKFDKDVLDRVKLLTRASMSTSNQQLKVLHSHTIYDKDSNAFTNSSETITFPEANADCNGLLSIAGFNFLNYVISNLTTNSTGIICNSIGFVPVENGIQHNHRILKLNDGRWGTYSGTSIIPLATTTTAGVMSAADKVKLENTVSATTTATPDTLGLVKQAADLTDLQADTDLEGVKAQFNQLLANLRAAGIMYQTPQP